MHNDKEYFLYIGISDDRQLFFEIPSSLQKTISLTVDELEHILNVAKVFLPKALADEDFYQNEWGKGIDT